MRIGWTLIAVFALTSCSKAPAFRPVATIEQVMEGIVQPASEAVFDAAVWENGVQVGGPKTPDDWVAVENAALAVAESGNLLMMSPRMKDESAWPARIQELMDASLAAAAAAKARSTDDIFKAGGRVYAACVSCHQQYIPQGQIPRSTT